MMDKITAENLKKDLESNKEITLINVLDKEYYNDCRIPGSINIPHTSNMQKELEGWDEDTYIVVYCASSECPASNQASKKLTSMGFSNVFLYEGGMREWKEKGYKIEGSCNMNYLNKDIATSNNKPSCHGKCQNTCNDKCSCKK
jgi:rhodanese-related sulfurtransferase